MISNNIGLAGAAAMLRDMDKILILTHCRPDGDTVGSAAALCRALRLMGKTAHVFENTDLTERFVPYLEGCVAPKDYEPQSIISVDTASTGMLCPGGDAYLGRIALSIDHHGSHEQYAQAVWVDAGAAACGEQILALVKELCGRLPKECCDGLYLAISTDTGCFQYSNTTANTLYAAAELKAAGVNTYAINKVMFGTKSLSRLRLESMLASSMELYDNGRVCLMCLTNDMMQKVGATENDIDDLAGFPRVVEGVDIGVLVRELSDTSSKCSLRSAGKANASEICQRLGGGGHPGAAGVTLDEPYTVLKEKILQAIGV